MGDLSQFGARVGSLAVRRAIERWRPRLTLHGHIHESVRLHGGQFTQVVGERTQEIVTGEVTGGGGSGAGVGDSGGGMGCGGGDGVLLNGVAVNGVVINGPAANGVPVNGDLVNEVAGNGVPVNGVAANDVAVNGGPVNGVAGNASCPAPAPRTSVVMSVGNDFRSDHPHCIIVDTDRPAHAVRIHCVD